jgi:DNA-binding XRE family transcriptional regulator
MYLWYSMTLSKKCPLTLQFPGALLDITQRIIRVINKHSGGRFSPRKLIPVNPKTVGDHLLLKRIKANLSQQEVAVNAGVSELTVSKWEHDQTLPTKAQWQVLVDILRLDSTRPIG